MKKKFIIFLMLVISVISLSACKKKSINLGDYLIEERNNLFTSNDELYFATFSSGMREENYNFDGIVNNMTEFGILSFSRIDKNPLANDNYTYIIKINDNTFTGFLTKSEYDNTYSADIQATAPNDATISVEITFTGYNYSQNLVNTSSEFSVDKTTAIDIANKELKEDIKNITQDKNNKIEVVMKLLRDYSSADIKNYYWYIGIVSTNGETLSILIDANSGEVIAKKV